jgi:hypothetical protein
MRRALATLGLALLPALAPAAVGTNAGDTVAAFKATTLDLSGDKPREHALDSRRRDRPTTYVFVGTQCATTGLYIPRLKEIEQRFGGKVEFVYVYPNRTDSPANKRTFHKEKKFAGRMIDDEDGAVTVALGAQKTAEAVVVGKNGTIVYRGAIDDNAREPAKASHPWLTTALTEHLAGKPVTTKTTPVAA